MQQLPRTRLIGKDYWVSYFRSRHIDLYRNSTEWVSFVGQGISAQRYTSSTKSGALRTACEAILAEEGSQLS